MKLEPIFLSVVLFAAGLFAGCAIGCFISPRVFSLPPNDPYLRHHAIHVGPVINPVFEPLIEEDFPPGAQRPQYADVPKNRAHGL